MAKKLENPCHLVRLFVKELCFSHDIKRWFIQKMTLKAFFNNQIGDVFRVLEIHPWIC
jgi:hypothetical protein